MASNPRWLKSDQVSEDEQRRARRQFVKSAVASVPVVLTITAGRARAQGNGSVGYSEPDPEEGLEGEEETGTPLGEFDAILNNALQSESDFGAGFGEFE